MKSFSIPNFARFRVISTVSGAVWLACVPRSVRMSAPSLKGVADRQVVAALLLAQHGEGCAVVGEVVRQLVARRRRQWLGEAHGELQHVDPGIG